MPLSGNEKYSYEIPLWGIRLLLIFCIFLSIGSGFLFYHFENWAGDAPIFIKWFILVVSLVFLTIAIQPKKWRPWVYFFVDKEGIYFPSECPTTNNTKWLNIAWSNIGNIKKEKFFDRTTGISVEIIVSQSEIDEYFRSVAMANKILGINQVRDGFFSIGYSNAFQNPQKTEKILNALKSKYT